MQSIHELPGRSANHRETLRQIGLVHLMTCGAQMKTVVHDDPNGMVKFKVSGRFWLTVKLMSDDTYAVEVATVRKKNGLPEYKVIAQAFDVYATDLAYTVVKLGDRA